MAGSLNKVQIIGNLGKDPEMRYGQDGSKFATFSVATSERWKDKATNEMKEKTEWHKVVVFNERLADICEQYLRKGTKVYLEGQLQTRKWTDNAGIEKYMTEVVLTRFRGEMLMLDGRNDSQGSYQGSQLGSSTPPALDNHSEPNFDIPGGSSPARAAPAAQNEFDDEIPF
jgi:single-strand DNA-binding protein